MTTTNTEHDTEDHRCEHCGARGHHDEDQCCEGHPAGPYGPMGETVYCDGSCRP